MNAARRIEHSITRHLLERREEPVSATRSNIWLERLIAVLAATAWLSVLGSYFQEVLWALLAAATLAMLR